MKIFIVGFLGFGLLFLAFAQEKSPEPYEFPELEHFPPMPENSDNPVTREGVNLGRQLFYDPILSKDSNRSCAGCHQPKKAFSGDGDRFGLERDIPPLFNLAWHPSYSWDGKAPTLRSQIFETVRNRKEMNLSWSEAEARVRASEIYLKRFNEAFGKQRIDSILIAKALEQFLNTLISHDSKFDKAMNQDTNFTKKEKAGFSLVTNRTKGNCIQCHTIDANMLGTDFRFYDIGLESVNGLTGYKDPGRGGVTGKKADLGKFKTPSLRNLILTAPYMHDGRFDDLREVLEFYDSDMNQTPNRSKKLHRGISLTAKERDKVIAFLKTLTDSTFINKPESSSPYK